MIFRIVKFFIRNISDEWRLRLMITCMIESALVRPGNSLDAHLSVEKDGTFDTYYNRVEWSYPKKDRAREMLRYGFSMTEVATAFGVTSAELTNQLLDREPIEKIVSEAHEAMQNYCKNDTSATHPVTGLTWDQMKRETHNNLNHCNAAGCDGISCGIGCKAQERRF